MLWARPLTPREMSTQPSVLRNRKAVFSARLRGRLVDRPLHRNVGVRTPISTETRVRARALLALLYGSEDDAVRHVLPLLVFPALATIRFRELPGHVRAHLARFISDAGIEPSDSPEEIALKGVELYSLAPIGQRIREELDRFIRDRLGGCFDREMSRALVELLEDDVLFQKEEQVFDNLFTKCPHAFARITKLLFGWFIDAERIRPQLPPNVTRGWVTSPEGVTIETLKLNLGSASAPVFSTEHGYFACSLRDGWLFFGGGRWLPAPEDLIASTALLPTTPSGPNYLDW
jgi:hypothetical protein